MRFVKPKRGDRLLDKAPTSKQLLEMAEIIAERKATVVLEPTPPLPNPFDEAVPEKERV